MAIDGTLVERLRTAPVLHDEAAAAERLRGVEPAFPPGFLMPPLRALLIALADHSPFLWRLPADAERLAIVHAHERLRPLFSDNRLAQRLHAALTVPTRRGGSMPSLCAGARSAGTARRRCRSGASSPTAGRRRRPGSIWCRPAPAWPRGRPASRPNSRPASARRSCGRATPPPSAPMARETGHRGPLDLKLAPGTLLDLDFLAQALTLGHAHTHPDLLGLPADAVPEQAGAHAILPFDAAERLAAAYRLFDAAHHWTRRVGTDGECAFGRRARAHGGGDGRVERRIPSSRASGPNGGRSARSWPGFAGPVRPIRERPGLKSRAASERGPDQRRPRELGPGEAVPGDLVAAGLARA